jgi:hypothetical protein
MLDDPLRRWENEGGAIEAALEQDQHRAGDAHPACEPGVFEGDSAEPPSRPARPCRAAG